MSAIGSAEVASIFVRLTPLAEGRVYEDIPDEENFVRWPENGSIKPFVLVQPMPPVSLARDRGMAWSEDQQPHTLPVRVMCFANLSSAARDLHQQAQALLVGWAPTTDAGEMRSLGGGQGSILDAESKPSRFYRSGLYETHINYVVS